MHTHRELAKARIAGKFGIFNNFETGFSRCKKLFMRDSERTEALDLQGSGVSKAHSVPPLRNIAAYLGPSPIETSRRAAPAGSRQADRGNARPRNDVEGASAEKIDIGISNDSEQRIVRHAGASSRWISPARRADLWLRWRRQSSDRTGNSGGRGPAFRISPSALRPTFSARMHIDDRSRTVTARIDRIEPLIFTRIALMSSATDAQNSDEQMRDKADEAGHCRCAADWVSWARNQL